MPKVRVQLGMSGDSPALRMIGKRRNIDIVLAQGTWPTFHQDDWMDVMELNVVEDSWYQRMKPNKLKVNLAILSAEWDLKGETEPD